MEIGFTGETQETCAQPATQPSGKTKTGTSDAITNAAAHTERNGQAEKTGTGDEDMYYPVVGDLVENISTCFRSGASMYDMAVVVSARPFILTSEEGDMMWTCTIRPEDVRAIGKASPEAMTNGLKRLRDHLKIQNYMNVWEEELVTGRPSNAVNLLTECMHCHSIIVRTQYERFKCPACECSSDGMNDYQTHVEVPDNTMAVWEEKSWTAPPMKPTEALLPGDEDWEPFIMLEQFELWKCCGCGARTRTDGSGDQRIDQCTCTKTQSGTFVGWVVDGAGAMIVWEETIP